jgi:hypothetical protein
MPLLYALSYMHHARSYHAPQQHITTRATAQPPPAHQCYTTQAPAAGAAHLHYRHYNTHQWLRFGFDPFVHLTALEEAEIHPGKDYYTRIKPLNLTNDHGRCITVTPERTLASVRECPLNI